MRVLIIADAPGVLNISDTEYDKIIVLDGAVAKLSGSTVIPDYIIGDMDAAPQETLDFLAAKGAIINKIDDQNSTDLDKGMIHADDLGATKIDIINALGGRMDHTLYNTRILKKYYRQTRPVTIHNGDECIEYYTDCTLRAKGTAGSLFSVMSAPEVTVYSQGLKYDMDGLHLQYGSTESACNSLSVLVAEIEFKGSALVIYDKSTTVKLVH